MSAPHVTHSPDGRHSRVLLEGCQRTTARSGVETSYADARAGQQGGEDGGLALVVRVGAPADLAVAGEHEADVEAAVGAHLDDVGPQRRGQGHDHVGGGPGARLVGRRDHARRQREGGDARRALGHRAVPEAGGVDQQHPAGGRGGREHRLALGHRDDERCPGQSRDTSTEAIRGRVRTSARPRRRRRARAARSPARRRRPRAPPRPGRVPPRRPRRRGRRAAATRR